MRKVLRPMNEHGVLRPLNESESCHLKRETKQPIPSIDFVGELTPRAGYASAKVIFEMYSIDVYCYTTRIIRVPSRIHFSEDAELMEDIADVADKFLQKDIVKPIVSTYRNLFDPLFAIYENDMKDIDNFVKKCVSKFNSDFQKSAMALLKANNRTKEN